MKKTDTTSYDILGISTTTICLVHCVVFPLIAIIPLGLDENIWVDVVFGTIGLFIVLKILLSKTSQKIKLLLGCSITLIWISIIIHIFFHIHSYLIFIGGFGMIIGHYINYKLHRYKNSKMKILGCG